MQHIWVVLGVLFVLLNIAAGLIWLERRMLAMWQDRLGPNRAGPFGLLQPMADGLKLFMKEEIIPLASSKFLFIRRFASTNSGVSRRVVLATEPITATAAPIQKA